tara:strand:+ start:14 stop:571 length:558 start_codon:yes stop_codon:yes gene_type:complete
MQRLDKFTLPKKFRGRNKFVVQLWWIIQSTLFALSPQFMYSWRSFLLRLFGAKIGRSVIIRPTVRVTYPWKLKIGDYSWIGDYVELYTLGDLYIGNNVVVSQRSYICTASHKYNQQDFAIYNNKVEIKDGCWIATDVYIGPGVTVNRNSVIGARSSVFKDVPEGKVCVGTPAKVIKKREFLNTKY